MPTWTDNFDRANGPLGPNWETPTGTATITSEWVTFVGQTRCYPTHNHAGGNVWAEIRCMPCPNNGYSSRVLIKATTDGQDAYSCYLSAAGAVVSINIQRVRAGGGVVLATALVPHAQGTTVTLKLDYTDTHLTAYMDGAVGVEADDGLLQVNDHVGMQHTGYNGWIDRFSTSAPSSVGFAVAPLLVYPGSTPTDMTATGTGTSWTPGTPGDPAFTADHGTITDQVISAAGAATFHYAPGEYLGPVVFTDPSTGEIASITVTTETTPPSGGGECPFDAEFVRAANNTGHVDAAEQILTNMTTIWPENELYPSQNTVEILNNIWQMVWDMAGNPLDPANSNTFGQILAAMMGSYTPTVQLYDAARTTSIRQELEQTHDALTTLVTEGFLTLQNVIDQLGGNPLKNHQDILDAIAAISSGSNQDVLDWLNLYLGTTGPTLDQLGTMISDLATIAGYTLGDVQNWINAIPATDLTPVTHKLDHIQPNEAHTLTTLTDAIVTVNGHAAAVDTSLAAYRTGNLYTVQDILDAISAVEAKVDAISVVGAPVWPGIGSVTLGAPVALVDQLVLTAPMHGILVNVTTPPTGLGQYNVGGRRLDYGQMRLAFETDNGELEGWQYFGFEQAIYTPHTMAQAAKCRFQLLGGLGGTVTPWTRS